MDFSKGSGWESAGSPAVTRGADAGMTPCPPPSNLRTNGPQSLDRNHPLCCRTYRLAVVCRKIHHPRPAGRGRGGGFRLSCGERDSGRQSCGVRIARDSSIRRDTDAARDDRARREPFRRRGRIRI